MRILERARRLSDALGKDVLATGGLKAYQMKNLALLATLGGIGSDDWSDYMTILASNEDQLKRLTGQDALAGESYVKESSAYLVTNSTCGGHTTDRLPQFVDARIDDQLNSETDPNFVRVMEIELLP